MNLPTIIVLIFVIVALGVALWSLKRQARRRKTCLECQLGQCGACKLGPGKKGVRR